MNVDLGIMLPGANPTHMEYSAMQEVLKKIKEGQYIFTGQVLMTYQVIF